MTEEQFSNLAQSISFKAGESMIDAIKSHGLEEGVAATVMGLTEALAKAIAAYSDEENRKETVGLVCKSLKQGSEHFAAIMGDMDRVLQIMRGGTNEDQ